MRRRIIVLVTLALGSLVLLADEQKSKIEKNPAYDKMKTLVGSWAGLANEGNQKIPTNARFKMIADDSALMAWHDVSHGWQRSNGHALLCRAQSAAHGFGQRRRSEPPPLQV